jgi:type II secretion system protein C
MNRFHLELAEMDRKRRLRLRVVSVLGAAALISVAMWSAGVPNASWFAWMLDSQDPAVALSTQQSVQPTKGTVQIAATDRANRLRLLSTTPGRNSSEGAAQIASGTSEPLTYAAGALLENGASLTEVHADHVILVRGAQKTALYVEGVAAQANQKRVIPVNDALLAVEDTPSPIIASKVTAPPTFTEVVRAAPRFENDAIVGFDVYPGTSAGQFSRLGLQSGDLLVAVDGAPLGDTEALNTALKNIAEGRSVVATVRRGDEHVELALDGASLATAQTLAGVPSLEP